jgi:predicted acetyltransferase
VRPVSDTLTFADLSEAHFDRALDLIDLVFHDRPDEDARERHRETLRGCRRVGAYDGTRLVGVLAAHAFSMAVPGGELGCAGVTFVCVAPTHRRQGVLTGMIGELYRGCPEAGQPLAALWTEDAAIYGRFGFGPATHAVNVEIDAEHPVQLRIEPDPRPLRLVPPAEAPALLGPYFERTRADRAGRVARSTDRWADVWLADVAEDDDELSPSRIVALGDPLAGYAIYRTKSGDDSGFARVDELEADTPAVAAALWRYLVSIDRVGRLRAWGRPLDDPILHFATDRDHVRTPSLFPALWLRLTDVRAALLGRTWAADLDLVLDVRDPLVPGNAGRHRLSATGGSCAYEPTTDAPDLAIDVADLAACYLGDSQVRRMVRAGVAVEHTPGAAATLDAALATALLPHTTDEF